MYGSAGKLLPPDEPWSTNPDSPPCASRDPPGGFSSCQAGKLEQSDNHLALPRDRGRHIPANKGGGGGTSGVSNMLAGARDHDAQIRPFRAMFCGTFLVLPFAFSLARNPLPSRRRGIWMRARSLRSKRATRTISALPTVISIPAGDQGGGTQMSR